MNGLTDENDDDHDYDYEYGVRAFLAFVSGLTIQARGRIVGFALADCRPRPKALTPSS